MKHNWARRSLMVAVALLVGSVGLVDPGPGRAYAATVTEGSSVETLVVAADRDVEVRSDRPDSSYGSRPTMGVDGSPERHSLVRFTVSGVTGREVSRVRLRMVQTDASRVGGVVSAMSSTSWPESVTWNTRPTVDGPVLATFGAVISGVSYEVDLPLSTVRADGSVALGLTTTVGDGSDWATRESSTPPVLLIDLQPVTTPPADPPPAAGVLTQVAAPSEASSNPTYYATNHRIVESAGGRVLTVHGRHATGVQLAWRDDGSQAWSRQTTGAVSDGVLLGGTGTGDWPSSIALVTDAGGAQAAVVVWSGPNFGAVRPLQMRVLTDLEAPAGPRVGPVVTLTAPALGAARADVGTETGADGQPRVVLTWSERTSSSTYALKAAWLDDHRAAVPVLTSTAVLLQDTSGSRSATVATTPRGARVAARADGGRLRVYGHDVGTALAQWWSSGAGVATPTGAYPSAAGLPSGDVMVVASRDLTQGVVTVAKFSGRGQTPTTELEMSGYADPGLAGEGTGSWLAAVRLEDGFVVSRSTTGQGGWSTTDVVRIGTEGGGGHEWPSIVSGPDGSRHLVVRGPGSSSNRSSVLAWEGAAS